MGKKERAGGRRKTTDLDKHHGAPTREDQDCQEIWTQVQEIPVRQEDRRQGELAPPQRYRRKAEEKVQGHRATAKRRLWIQQEDQAHSSKRFLKFTVSNI